MMVEIAIILLLCAVVFFIVVHIAILIEVLLK